MKIARLFEIVYILLDKPTVTAKELAEKFEVSTRTIYRDIDVLSSCGIPIYTNKGKGGGISLLDGFKIDKTLLTKDEQSEIIAALQGIKATDVDAGNSALSKLSSFFNENAANWIDIDFSFWGSNTNFKNKFEKLKKYILNRKAIKITYSSLKGQTTDRIIHPIKLQFRGISWYLYAFCTEKEDFRVFKINRITNIEETDIIFNSYQNIPKNADYEIVNIDKNETIILKIDKSMAFKVYDDFPMKDISTDENNNFIVETKQYDSHWIEQYILSYGAAIECLSPIHLKNKIKNTLHKTINNYINMTF